MSASSYGRGARVLSVGIGLTGLVTFSYFSVASYVVDADSYARIALLWSLMFVIVTVIYRPIEQLLAREIGRGDHPLRTAATIQVAFATIVAAAMLALRGTIEDELFDGYEALYWILFVGVLAYAASYFARGYLAGSKRFGLYGGLVLLEATSRILFALAVAVGVAEGQTAVALGMAAAPLASLVVVPFGLRRAQPGTAMRLRAGGTFAVAALFVLAAEQAILNAAVLTVDQALAGVVFNVLLIARAPLQLFQAVQGSLLPHLAGATGEEFRRAVRITVLATAGFAAAVAVALLAIGPFAMDILFDDAFDYERVGLAVVAVGMGLHLAAGTLHQAALARDQAPLAAIAWVVSATLFVAFMLSDAVGDEVLRTELAYAASTAVLCGLLSGLYRRA